jgi:hypothetical protein
MSDIPVSNTQYIIEAPGPYYLGARHLGDYAFFWSDRKQDAIVFLHYHNADMVMMAVRQLAPHLFVFEKALRNAGVISFKLGE